MSVKDARKELKERGITDPYKVTLYSKVARNQQASQEDKETNRKEASDQTQSAITPVRRPTKAKQDTPGIQQNNRFAGMEEESLDEEDQPEDSNADMLDIDELWGSSTKPQRRKATNRPSNESSTKANISKRLREASPKTAAKTKESEKQESPPTKRGVIVDYPSTSEEEAGGAEATNKSEEKGLPIPTLVTNPGVQSSRERIPNPFRRDEDAEWVHHPLRLQPATPERNDLEGVKEERSKMFGKQAKETNTHPTACGRDSCFWAEKEKLKGKLREEKIKELISDFVKDRKPPETNLKTEHQPTCLCVTCIKRKVSESKEKVLKQI